MKAPESTPKPRKAFVVPVPRLMSGIICGRAQVIVTMFSFRIRGKGRKDVQKLTEQEPNTEDYGFQS